jgi:hypothetical protein
MWFHRPFRADDWLFVDQESSVAFGGRGFVRAQFWTANGDLVCTATQEALLRAPTPFASGIDPTSGNATETELGQSGATTELGTQNEKNR